MLDLSSDLVVLSSLEDGLRFSLEPDEIKNDYPDLARNLSEIKLLLEDGGPSPEGGIFLHDLIESADENASFEAQKFRNDLASSYANFARKGLHLRSIDRDATTAAQERAIAQMEPPIVSVKEGEIILKMGSKVTESDLEKYSKFLNLTVDERNLLPKRVFITLGTFLFSIFYISLIMPDFWRDTARSGIVSVAILVNLALSVLYWSLVALIYLVKMLSWLDYFRIYYP